MIDPAQIRAAASDFVEDEDLTPAVLDRLAWRRRNGFKRCTSCGEDLPVAAFGRDGSRRDGLEVRCRSCRRAPANP